MILLLLALLCCSPASAQSPLPAPRAKQVQPYAANPQYWQYKGKPVLLLGASGDDNLFQWPAGTLKKHLDSLAQAGGNYLRNTMSDRDENNLKAFYRTTDGPYDLNRWNDEYWDRFENFLRQTRKRNILVQIEVWDRFDHSRESWRSDPYNPANNVNYSFEESGLEADYPEHPGQNKQPFFFTVPGLDNNETVLRFQRRFVEKLMSISLKYDHVLYCIDNETSGKEAWGAYWADYLRTLASRKGRRIYVTEMWDDWDVKSKTHKRTLDHPERYDFIDISQNSQIAGPANWRNAQYVFDYIRENPRPVNSTKIYGSDQAQKSWRDRGITQEHALFTFCRNLIGGFASSRFHRPPSGLGLSEASLNCIQAVRKVESLAKFWDMRPRMDLLQERGGDNVVFLAAQEGTQYVVYFKDGGQATLNLGHEGTLFDLHWIEIATGDWGDRVPLKGGRRVDVSAHGPGGWFAVIRPANGSF
ncbi:MAG: hypothetical protein FWJ85_11760 [Solitalea sp.]